MLAMSRLARKIQDSALAIVVDGARLAKPLAELAKLIDDASAHKV
jgi:hypothetical protein